MVLLQKGPPRSGQSALSAPVPLTTSPDGSGPDNSSSSK
jgi:hypothetical protein